jgi:hypothetical protein
MSQQRGRIVSGLIDLPGLGAKFEGRPYRYALSKGVTNKPRRGRGTISKYAAVRPLAAGGTLAVHLLPRLDGWPEPVRFYRQAGTVTLTYDTGKTQTLPVRVDGVAESHDQSKQDGTSLTLNCTIVGDATYAGYPGTQGGDAEPAKTDQVQWEGSSKTLDPQGLASSAQVLIDVWGDLADTDAAEAQRLADAIAAFVAPAAGQKVRSATFARDSDDGGQIVVTTGLTDTIEDVVNPRTAATTDPLGLASSATVAAVNAVPITPAGLVDRGVTVQELNDARLLYVRQAGVRSTADDVEMPATSTWLDPLGLDSAGQQRTVYTTAAGAPGDPAPPLGTQIVAARTEQLDQLHSFKEWRFDVLNSVQRRTFPRISTTDDATNLEDEAVRAQVWDAAGSAPATPTDAPGNNVKLVTFTDVPVSPTQNMRVWLYGPRNPRDKLVLPNYETRADPESIESTAIRAGLDGETIADPVGYVLRRTRTMPVTVGLGVNRTLTVKEYGLRTTAEDVSMPGTWTEVDPLGLESRGKITRVYDTALGTPADPTPPAGLQTVTITTREVNQIVSEGVWTYDVVNSRQKVEFRETRETIDPHGIESEKREAAVFDGGGTPPAFPASPAGLKPVWYYDQPLTPDKSVRVFRHAARDSVDDAVLPRTWTHADPSDLESRGQVAAFNATPVVPSGYVSRGSKGVYLTPADVVNVTDFGLTTTAQDVTYPRDVGEWTQQDGNQSVDCEIFTNPTDAPSTVAATIAAANSSNLTFGGVRVRRVTPTKLLKEYRYRSSDTVVRFQRQSAGHVDVCARDDGGSPKLYVGAIERVGSTLWAFEVVRTPYPGGRMFFTIEKRIAAGALPDLSALEGKTNAAAFLGLAAGKVAFLGRAGRALVNSSGAGVNVADLGASFEYRSTGFCDLKKAREGWNWTTTDLSGVTPGTWVSPATLGLDTAVFGTTSFAGVL